MTVAGSRFSVSLIVRQERKRAQADFRKEISAAQESDRSLLPCIAMLPVGGAKHAAG
jgi:hypothetical protein